MKEPLTRKQAEYFTFLIIICTVTAAAILVIDYSIKNAIIEQSNRTRLAIERWEKANGRETQGTNHVRRSVSSSYVRANVPVLLDPDATGMEAEDVRGRDIEAAIAPQGYREANPPPDDGNREIPDPDIFLFPREETE